MNFSEKKVLVVGGGVIATRRCSGDNRGFEKSCRKKMYYMEKRVIL